ncbi:MAG: Nif3-like dinuclear metal center hexameric protein [Actinomycetota bacterium]
MGAIVSDWLELLDRRFPPSWAEEWDNPGLQVGDRSWPADRALVALDPLPEVVGEAARRGCGILVTHHPLLFRPMASLDLADPVSRAVASALEGKVAVVACHTNADVAQPGVSDSLAATVEVEVTGPLARTDAGSRVKLVTFVPPEATAKVLDAVAGAGAGIIGEYTHCSFRVRGAGTFLPSERAHPAVGERGELNEVEEDRLEVVVPREHLEPAVEAMMAAHPYEEVAYDVYPLAGGGLGMGRVGRLPEPATVAGFAASCGTRLHVEPRFAGDPEGEVRTVALCGGAGASLIPRAIASGADAYLTGDVKHHQALEAAGAGLAVIDAGHHGTEWPFVRDLAAGLQIAGVGEALVSEISTDPFRRP